MPVLVNESVVRVTVKPQVVRVEPKPQSAPITVLTGQRGPQGLKGDTGAQGPIGQTGAVGPQGPAGARGSDGHFSGVTDVKLGAGSVQLTSDDSAKTLISTGDVTWLLPPAQDGLGFEIINRHTTTIQANGATIDFGGAVSQVGGVQITADAGASVLLRSAGGSWFAVGQPAGAWMAG